MLDQLELALRKYQQIAPVSGREMTLNQAQQISDWLEFDVGRIVDDLLSRPGFRQRVRWPMELLCGPERPTRTFSSPQRELVVSIDRQIVNFAKELACFAASEPVHCRLAEHDRLDARANQIARNMIFEPPSVLSSLAQIEAIAQRPWNDLVSVWDFFHPSQPLSTADAPLQASLLPYFNPKLRAPGDFVSRCLEIRIDELSDTLNQFIRLLYRSGIFEVANLTQVWASLTRLQSTLREEIANLKRLCFDGVEARIRDSCIALLQIRVGYRQSTDLSWLGTPQVAVAGVADISHRVLRRNQWDVPERAAAALLDVANIVRLAQSPDDLIEDKKQTTCLVMVEEQRDVFLNGTSATTDKTADWNGKHKYLWELLWALADRARLRRSVDGYCLSNPIAARPVAGSKLPEPLSEQAVKDRRSDLKKLISADLNRLIVPAGSGTYRLNLEPEDICLLGWFTQELLVELPVQEPRPSLMASPPDQSEDAV